MDMFRRSRAPVAAQRATAAAVRVLVFLSLVRLPWVGRSSRPSPPALTGRFSADISFLAFFLTDFHSPHADLLSEYILSSSPPPWFRYYFVNYSRAKQSSPPCLASPVQYRRLLDLCLTKGKWWHMGAKSPDLLAKTFFSFEFFLANSSAHWFYRGTDDVIVNIPRLGHYIRHLDARHNPLTQIVLQGNCLVFPGSPNSRPYLQGGAGYVFSRLAVERLRPFAVPSMLNGHTQEDWWMGELCYRLGVTGVAATSDHFLGYTFSWDDQKRLVHGNVSQMRRCPVWPSAGQNGCRRFLSPLRRVIFFHQHMNMDAALVAFARRVFQAPVWIKWYMVDYFPKICYDKSADPR
jgi:hypothetical protein